MELITAPKPHLNLRALDDLNLVTRAVTGETSAFTILFDRYRPAIQHYISRQMPDSTDVHDLTMEAFGKAFLKLGTYVPNHAFSTWLFKIARNNCIDFSRRRRLERLHQTSIELSSFTGISDREPDPETAMMRQERMAMVYSLLQELHPRYRRMLELRYYEDMRYDEIAQKLNLPIGTIKAQLFRAKEMMRQLLESPRAHA